MFVSQKINSRQKEALMNIVTTVTPTCNPKSVIESLNSEKGLPLSEVLSQDSINSSLSDIPYRQRYGIYPPEITLWAFLSQVLSPDSSLDAAVSRVIAFHLSQGREEEVSSNTSAYSQARSKLPEQVISDLTRESAKQMEEGLPESWLWRMMHHLKLVDGSTISMPDTEKNQALYPQPDSQEEGVGFPIARIVTVTSCVTGAVLDCAMGPYSGKKTGEHALLRQILDAFQPGDVALGDCYYASYFLIALLMRSGVDVIFPMHAARDFDFRKGEKLGEKDHIVKWIRPAKPEWMDQKTYDNTQEEISIREVSITTTIKGFRPKTRVLVTTFLDPRETSKNDLNKLYSYRWWVELDIRSIKTTLQMDVLSGKTPEMVRKEIWVHLLAYNMIRKVMVQSALKHGKKPRELSFKGALNVIVSFRDRGILCESDNKIYSALLKAISRKCVGNRPGRQEPRVVKRRPKSFSRMQKPRQSYYQRAA
jgi:hypothetical protein